MSHPLDELNPAQREAVLHTDGPLMVLAGAGSGKTRVITRRIARMLRDGVHPAEVLAVTFTNKAAGEMAARVEALGGHRVHVSTFHSAAARFLRIDGHHLGYPRNFSIYDTYDRDTLLKMLMQEHGLGHESVRPADVGRKISRLKNLGVAPEDFVAGLSPVDSIVRELYEPFQRRLFELAAMDFDDLLLRFCDLLAEFPEVAEVYQNRYRYLLVDEFQDTNLVQYRMLRLLAGQHQNICVVGDPDQSIYRFRGAEIRNILDFENDYPGTTIVRLETNYRSTGCILEAAQGVIANNEERMEKTLRTDNDFGSPATLLRSESANDEAEEIAGRLSSLLSEGVDANEVAVFYRTHSISRGLEQALRKLGVPYQIVGGLSFFERREIKDLLAFLRVVVNPLDDVSMERIINVPPRGIGKVTLNKLRERARNASMSLYEAVLDEGIRGTVSGKARAGLADLAGVLEGVRSAETIEDAFDTVLEGTGYLDYACGLGDPEDITRQENIEELKNDIISFEQDHESGDLAGYLQHVSLLTPADVDQPVGPRVSLMTIHSAKGLEFDHVYLVGIEEGLFPHARSMEGSSDIEEERRLMYVALTRARLALTLSYCRFRMIGGLPSASEPSRFLQEIPTRCIAKSRTWSADRYALDDDLGGGTGFSDYVGEPDISVDEFHQGDPGEIGPGTRVIHAVYGPGKVVHVRGEGSRAKIIVEFKDGRQRTLLPEYESLQVMPTSDEWSE